MTSDDRARAATPRDPDDAPASPAAGSLPGPASSPVVRTAAVPGIPPGDVEPALARLAAAYGVATGYLDARDQPVVVSPVAVRQVLELMGVDTSDPVAALAAVETAPWRRLAPPSVVVKAAAPGLVLVRVPAGLDPATVRCELTLADGTVRELVVGPAGERREVDGAPLVARPTSLPDGLPLGDHVLRVEADGRTATTQIIAVPDRVPEPGEPATGPDRAATTAGPGTGSVPAVRAGGRGSTGRMWGWMVQLYSLRSAGSWGMGDYADLATLAAWSGSAAGGRADVLLVNPLHAVAPTLPVQTSPYYPTSRRFLAPLYLRPEHTPEYAAADAATRAIVDGHAAAARAAHQAAATDGPAGTPSADEFGPLIDRDAVWEAKRAALELLFARSAAAARAVADGGGAAGEVDDFALWCALAERHGPDWRAWPAALRDREPAAVAAARTELAERVGFHRWLQARAEQQVAAAQAAARAAGMRVGIVHDLAVGVDPAGADTWADRAAYAVGVSIGAPPDTFNQQGQDWGLPPWRPDHLAETGYAPLRRMIAAVLSRGGGLRVDHILGLFRLWWVPGGAGAAGGTYVRYDAEAMLGVLALEAAKAGALVVGEDLGTVERTVASTLANLGVFGSSVLWFENDADGAPLPPGAWRPRTMASVTTHDLPTAAGFLLGEHIRARAERGLLSRPVAEEAAEWRASRDALLAHLQSGGLLAPGPDLDDEPAPERVEAAVLGMHRFLVATPARILLAAPGDAVGDRHQPNLPSTVDSYPNWRLPLQDADGRQLSLEELMADERVARLVAVLAEAAGSAAAPR